MTEESSGLASNPLESVRYTAGTDIGMRREENQDSFGVIKTDRFRLFIVADGMGGVKGGATASGMAVNIIEQMIKDKSALEDVDLVEAITVANRMIFEKGSHESELNGMGTTLVALAFIGTELIVANVGDSRAYRIREDRIKRLTEDHTLVMELVRSGTISLEQAGNHPVSHMLTRSLGPTPEVEVDCFSTKDGPQRGDRYLLCSDGLYNLVTEKEVFEIVTSHPLDEAIEVLIDLANQRGGTDNITVILVQLDDNYPILEAVKTPQGAPRAADSLGHAASLNGDNANHSTNQVEHEEKDFDVEEILGFEFDPFAIPDDEESKGDKAATDGDGSSKGAVGASSEQTSGQLQQRPNPIITGGVSLEQFNREIGPDDPLVGPAVEQQSDYEDPDYDEAEERASRLSSKMLIALGIIAGFLGGGLAVVLFNKGAAPRIAPPTVPSAFEQPAIPNVKIANLESEFSKSPITAQPETVTLPELGPLTVDDVPDNGGAEQRDPEEQGGELSGSEQGGSKQGTAMAPDGSSPQQTDQIEAPIEDRSGGATLENLRRRSEKLQAQLAGLRAKMSMFDGPLSGELGGYLQSEGQKKDNISNELLEVKDQLDVATRKLATWYGRRNRLQEADLTNLATEVAVTSAMVKEKKEAFELATWEYLKEAEVLRYLPSDKLQKGKVEKLAETRNQRLHELTDGVHDAIDKAIKDSESEITTLTLQRERLNVELEQVHDDITFVKALLSGDKELRNKKQKELEREIAVTEGEFKEVENLLLSSTSPSGEEVAQEDNSVASLGQDETTSSTAVIPSSN